MYKTIQISREKDKGAGGIPALLISDVGKD
jgi:hypothetical protein